MTPERLEREILDELEANFGRVAFGLVVSALNVEQGLVEEKIKKMVREDPTLVFEDGELMRGSVSGRVVVGS